MAAYHVVLVHFPMALWMTAALAILIRAFSSSALALSIDRALTPLLLLGFLSGAAAFAVGLMVWPWEAVSSSPLGRNHALLAAWTLTYWTLMLITRWWQGEAVWHGIMRFVMAGLALIGAGLLGITGTLGGHLIGVYTDVSEILRRLGWEVYRTFYLPDTTLIALAAAIVLLLAIGWFGRKPQTT